MSCAFYLMLTETCTHVHKFNMLVHSGALWCMNVVLPIWRSYLTLWQKKKKREKKRHCGIYIHQLYYRFVVCMYTVIASFVHEAICLVSIASYPGLQTQQCMGTRLIFPQYDRGRFASTTYYYGL